MSSYSLDTSVKSAALPFWRLIPFYLLSRTLKLILQLTLLKKQNQTVNPLQGSKICQSIPQAFLPIAIHLFCFQPCSLTARDEFSPFPIYPPEIPRFLLPSSAVNSVQPRSVTPRSSFSLFPPTANFSPAISPFFPQSDPFLSTLVKAALPPPGPPPSLSLRFLALGCSSLLHRWRGTSSA